MHYSSQETINQILSLRKEGKTYLEIQKLTGCCAKTISKYCVEAGLSENSKKVQITPELIEEIQRRYNEIGNLKEVAKEYHIAATTLRKHGLQVKNGKSTEEIVTQASCAQKAKLKAIYYKGGECQICGYKKSLRALQFHHLDPNQKDFGISGGTKSFERMKPELDKCILVCANCHSEIHDGITQIPENISMIAKEDFPEELQDSKFSSRTVSTTKNYKHICPVCNTPFKAVKGKIYCSKECRDKARNLPTKEELLNKYNELGSWKRTEAFYKIGLKTREKILFN